MNYKKLIKNKALRLKILKLLDFIPDKTMIYLQYYISTGRWLSLKNPQRFTEKLQWYKLYYRNPLMTKCVDKYDVREYVISKGLEDILIPIYGVYDNANEINFETLPNKFVLKTTNGSHTNIICENKEQLNYNNTRTQLNNWINSWEGKMGREWAYYNSKGKIICEHFLETVDNNLIDYKFFCFNGIPYFFYIVTDRNQSTGLKLGIFDLDFNQLNIFRSDIAPLDYKIEKPDKFDEMIEIAKTLSEDFPHVRVDLYEIKDQIFFGELTFYDGSGYKGFNPDQFDYEIGEKFIVPKEKL